MHVHTYTDTDNHFSTASFPGQPDHAGTRKVKPVWILIRQEMMGFGNMAVASAGPYAKNSALCSRHITTTLPHDSLYRPGALHDTEPTVSKQRRQT